MASQVPFGDGVSPLAVALAGNSTGNSAVTVADGADVALGATDDAADTNSANAGTMISFLKGTVKLLVDGATIIQLPSKALLSDNSATPNTTQIGACLMVYDGDTWDRERKASTFKDQNGAAVTTTGNSVWTPAANKKIRLMGGQISLSLAGSVAFHDGAANGAVLFRSGVLAANSAVNFDLGQGNVSGTANNALFAVSTVNGAMTGTLYGTEES